MLSRFQLKHEGDISINRMTTFSHKMINVDVFVVQGESPGCRVFGTASMLEWLRYLLPHHSQGSSTERWSRSTLRVVTAGVFYVLRGVLKFILNNSGGDGSAI